jgi:hypothetical protein
VSDDEKRFFYVGTWAIVDGVMANLGLFPSDGLPTPKPVLSGLAEPVLSFPVDPKPV